MARIFVENFKTIGQLKRMLLTNEISRDLSWMWASDGDPTVNKALGPQAEI